MAEIVPLPKPVYLGNKDIKPDSIVMSYPNLLKYSHSILSHLICFIMQFKLICFPLVFETSYFQSNRMTSCEKADGCSTL